MTAMHRNMWLGIAGVALAQCAVLGWMIWERAHLLATGREVVLEVIPVDPRSLFRGDYVILNYDISRINAPTGQPGPRAGDEIYVTLQKAEGDKWQAVQSSLARPTSTPPDQVVIKGRVQYTHSPTQDGPAQAFVRYGIESFFVPEGTGQELEKLVGEKKLAALVAVDDEGNAGIKGLVSEGKRVYEEPLL
jgi:uncharacterized membrane-anchored protein